MSDLTIPMARDTSLGFPGNRDTVKSGQLNIDDHSIRRLRIRTGRLPISFSATDECGIWPDIRSKSAYYSVIAGAVSKLPNNTRDARLALYDIAEIALTSELLQHPEISDEQMAVQRLALEWAIRKIESAEGKREQPEEFREKKQRYFLSFIWPYLSRARQQAA